jgi:hypothetical protein
LRLASASNYEEKMKLTKEIIEKFITKDAPNEIPISEEERKILFEQFKILSSPTDTEGKIEYVVEGSFDEIFDKIKEVQFLEMYRDVFPRYIRSKKCIPMLSKYMDDPNVIQSKQSIQFPYQNSDFKRQYLTQMDFDFMKTLAKDDLNWELSLVQSFSNKNLVQSSEGELNTYFSEINVLNNITCVEELTFIKYDIVLPYPIEHVISMRKF